MDQLSGDLYGVALADSELLKTIQRIVVEDGHPAVLSKRVYAEAWYFGCGTMCVLLVAAQGPRPRPYVKFITHTDKSVIQKQGAKLEDTTYRPEVVAALFDKGYIK